MEQSLNVITIKKIIKEIHQAINTTNLFRNFSIKIVLLLPRYCKIQISLKTLGSKNATTWRLVKSSE